MVKLQCKDIDSKPILTFLLSISPKMANSFDTNFENSIAHSFPEGTPRKLILAKMKKLIKLGLVDGCACGCRGDFEITPAGREHAERLIMELM